MKITVTGSLGNISKPLTEILIAAGHEVTVVSSSSEKAAAIEALGAKASIGSVTDIDFLTKAFAGADAVYTMVPPNMAATAWKKYIAGIGRNYVEAIKNAGVKNVVNLSSIGAHLPEGTGPITGMHYAELALNELESVNVLHLRPASFYTNFYNNAGMIKNMGIVGNNYPADREQVLADPGDIAAIAAEQLQQLGFKGKSFVYIVSSVHTGTEVASIIGKAIGKPALPWVEFKDEDVVSSVVNSGITRDVAENFAELGATIRSGVLYSDYNDSKAVIAGKTSLEDFAAVFAKTILIPA